ncbi:MAG: SagB/ThcOx family dehydrogenase [Prevotella sp.]|jgi:nitroreductase|nr:SagB/ThcOx family dehydrogenase [Prevotella sp.]
MKKAILFLIVLMIMGNLQAQDVISLPQPEVSKLSMSLGDALSLRRSERKYTDREISTQTLSTLLWAACGISDPKTGKITAPSAVNMQDIKIYVCTKDGVCLFNAKDNLLIKVSDKDLRDAIAGRQSFAKTAPVSLVLVSTKDSERAPNDRYGAMDAGYVSQNIYLACTALGLKTVARATMDFDTLKRELNLADTSYLELNHPISY